MKQIILNEKEYAEDCIVLNRINGNPFYSLIIIAKYYYTLGNKDKEVKEFLEKFIENAYLYPNKSKLEIENIISSVIKIAKKHNLSEINGIWITKSEMETIEGIKSNLLKRLAFTMLCLAKLAIEKNPKSNGWIKTSTKDIFQMARINIKTVDKNLSIGELGNLGLLEFPKRNDNVSSRVTFVDNDSDKILFVDDFRELGYAYLKYKGKNYVKCRECGRLIKNNSNGTRLYCDECKGYIPLNFKVITCVDCGKEIKVAGNNKRTVRCDECKKIKKHDYDKKRSQNNLG